MQSRVIAAVTAAAVALSGLTAAPAVAKDHKDQRALALLLGAVALGLIINSEQNRKVPPSPVPLPPPPPPPPPPVQHSRHWQDRHWPDQRWPDRGWPDRGWHARAPIPGECVYSIRSAQGLREVVSPNCLSDMGYVSRIPDECAFDIRTTYGTRQVYGTQCLRDFGYRIGDARY